jgi:hypothetical protein
MRHRRAIARRALLAPGELLRIACNTVAPLLFAMDRCSLARAARFMFALGGLTALGACTKLESGNVLPDAGQPAVSSSTCEHAEPPARPKSSSSSSASEREYVFASRAYDVGDSDDGNGEPRYPRLGYDVDHTCSGQGEGGSCKKPRWQNVAITDGPEGRDNSGNEVLYLASTTFRAAGGDVDAGNGATKTPGAFDSNLDARSGRTTVMYRVRHYNGEANDDEVQVDVFSGTLWTNLWSGPGPHWDERDHWRTTSLWLQDGKLSNDAPRFSDAHAYVRNNVLVAHLDQLMVGNAFAPAGTWRKVLVTGKFSHDGDTLELRDVVLTGRWPVNELLAFLAHTLNERTHEVECTEKAFYAATRPIYCQNVDLNSKRDDGSGVCDAVSIVFDMDTMPATLGEPIETDSLEWPDCPATDCEGNPLPGQ